MLIETIPSHKDHHTVPELSTRKAPLPPSAESTSEMPQAAMNRPLRNVFIPDTEVTISIIYIGRVNTSYWQNKQISTVYPAGTLQPAPDTAGSCANSLSDRILRACNQFYC